MLEGGRQWVICAVQSSVILFLRKSTRANASTIAVLVTCIYSQPATAWSRIGKTDDKKDNKSPRPSHPHRFLNKYVLGQWSLVNNIFSSHVSVFPQTATFPVISNLLDFGFSAKHDSLSLTSYHLQVLNRQTMMNFCPFICAQRN